ncbi:MAG: RluA family pseudouridine synthase [Polyangiaceae bacterium]
MRPDSVAEGAVVTVLRVPVEMAGKRLDIFVQSELKRTSRTRAQMIVEASAYDGENGRKLKSNDRVRAEQRVCLWRPAWDEVEVPTDLPILFEDEHFLAISKPAGVPVHPTARYHKNTVVKLLESKRPDETLMLAHRLDRETSGVLLLSKTSAADRAIKKMFATHDAIQKSYLAITWGVPREKKFRVDLPLKLDMTSTTKVRMCVADDGLKAGTRFELLEVRQRGDQQYGLLRCDLETGRQHQIRVHLAANELPIVGDKLYAFDEGYFKRDIDGEATDEDRERLELPRHALHAYRIELPHPMTNEPWVVEASLPDDMQVFWSSLTPTST